MTYPSTDAVVVDRVIVAFVVEKNGKIDGSRVIKDLSVNHVLSRQLLKIVSGIKWSPGILNGRPVAVLYELPITIDLEE
jgi:protein TonB